MKKLKRNMGIKFMTGALVLLVSILFLFPHQLAAEVCESALARCTIDAALVTLFSGIQSGLLYFSGCLVGYGWCLEYFS